MSGPPALLEHVESMTVSTDRLETHVLESGDRDGTPVVALHGSTSDSRFWERTLDALPKEYWGIAPDRRGCGFSETKPVDATRGMGDIAADVNSLLEELDLYEADRRIHLMGWSFGGGIAMRYLMEYPELVSTLTVVAPIPPQGFLGTKGPEAEPCYSDYAGSGAGLVDEEYRDRRKQSDRTGEDPSSPRHELTEVYCDPDVELDPEREEILLESMLRATIGPDNYPGTYEESDNWPGYAPGRRGERNAMSPKYCDMSPVLDHDEKPDVLWLRGAEDRVISTNSILDYGYLGTIGEVDGWPGPDVFPPQPMIEQTRSFFEDYEARGGSYKEIVIDGVGHTPQVEAPERFERTYIDFLKRNE